MGQWRRQICGKQDRGSIKLNLGGNICTINMRSKRGRGGAQEKIERREVVREKEKARRS